MFTKYDKNLINYVSKYKPPKREINLDEKHILFPIYNIKPKDDTKYNHNKNIANTSINHKHHKKEKVTSVSKIDNSKSIKKHHHHRHNSTGIVFKLDNVLNEDYNIINNINIINNEKRNKHKKSKEKHKKIENKEENLSQLYQKMKKQNNLLKHELTKREDEINKYKKKYENQDNIIKNLELILKEMINNKNKNKKTSSKHLKNNIKNSLNYKLNDDIFLDEEKLAIQAVDQHIIDELCPNPDLMSYEQLLELEENLGKVNKGLSNQQINNLPIIRYTKGNNNESKQCIICMEEFEEKEKVKLLPCAHIFHNNCIKQWLLKEKTCPFCKSEIG